MNRKRELVLASISLLMVIASGLGVRGGMFSSLSPAYGQDMPPIGKDFPGGGVGKGSAAGRGGGTENAPSQQSQAVLAGLQSKLQASIAKLKNTEKEEEKAAAKQELKATLEEIFNADMQARDAQVKEIDSRLTKLREQYKAREAAKDSIIDLQLAVLEKDASGLGFPFVRREATPPSGEMPLSQSKNDGALPSIPGANASQGEFISEYEKLRNQYRNGRYRLREAEENLHNLEAEAKKGDLSQDEIQKKLERYKKTWSLLNSPNGIYYEAERILDTKLKLLALDLDQAKAEQAIAEEELIRAQQVNEKKTNAVSISEITRMTAQLSTSRIKVERAKAIYDLFASIKEEPKKEEQPKPETPAPESNSRAR